MLRFPEISAQGWNLAAVVAVILMLAAFVGAVVLAGLAKWLQKWENINDESQKKHVAPAYHDDDPDYRTVHVVAGDPFILTVLWSLVDKTHPWAWPDALPPVLSWAAGSKSGRPRPCRRR